MDPFAASSYARKRNGLGPAVVVPCVVGDFVPGDRAITPDGTGTVVRAWPAFVHSFGKVPCGTHRVARVFVRLDGASPGIDCNLYLAAEVSLLSDEPGPEPAHDR